MIFAFGLAERLAEWNRPRRLANRFSATENNRVADLTVVEWCRRIVTPLGLVLRGFEARLATSTDDLFLCDAA